MGFVLPLERLTLPQPLEPFSPSSLPRPCLDSRSSRSLSLGPGNHSPGNCSPSNRSPSNCSPSNCSPSNRSPRHLGLSRRNQLPAVFLRLCKTILSLNLLSSRQWLSQGQRGPPQCTQAAAVAEGVNPEALIGLPRSFDRGCGRSLVLVLLQQKLDLALALTEYLDGFKDVQVYNGLQLRVRHNGP